jgi:hypothetical protein
MQTNIPLPWETPKPPPAPWEVKPSKPTDDSDIPVMLRRDENNFARYFTKPK